VRTYDDEERGGRQRSPRTGKRAHRSTNDFAHTLADQLRALNVPEVTPEPALSLPEINNVTDSNVYPIPQQGSPTPASDSTKVRSARPPAFSIEAPHGTVTLEAQGSTTVLPLKESEREEFLAAARSKLASEESRDKYIKAASVASTVLSFTGLALLLFGGYAAIKRSSQGEE